MTQGGAKARVRMTADTTSVNRAFDRTAKKAKNIGDSLQRTQLPLESMSKKFVGVATVVTGVVAAVRQYNEELEKGRKLLDSQRQLAENIASAGDISSSEQLQDAFSGALGAGRLNQQQLTDIYGSFRGAAPTADVSNVRLILQASQFSTGTRASPEQLQQTASIAGMLIQGGVDAERAYVAGFYASQAGGGKAGSIAKNFAALISAIGAEEALALLPDLIAARDSQGVVGRMRTQGIELGRAGVSGQQMVKQLGSLLTTEQQGVAAGIDIPTDFSFIASQRAGGIESMSRAEAINFASLILTSRSEDPRAVGNEMRQIDAANANFRRSRQEFLSSQDPNTGRRMMRNMLNFDIINEMAVSDEQVSTEALNVINQYLRRDAQGRLLVNPGTPPVSLQNNGQEGN